MKCKKCILSLRIFSYTIWIFLMNSQEFVLIVSKDKSSRVWKLYYKCEMKKKNPTYCGITGTCLCQDFFQGCCRWIRIVFKEIKHLSLRCCLVPYFSSSKYWYRDSIPESSFCQYFTMPMWHYPECLWYGLLLWQCKIWNIYFLDWTYYFLFYHFIRKDNWVLKSH